MRTNRSAQLLVTAVALCGAALGGCSGGTHGDARADIEKANQAFADAVAKNDVAAIGNLYTKDAAVLPPGTNAATGRAAIEEMWKGALASGIKSLHLATTETDTQGNTAVEIGTFEALGEGGASLDKGKYIVVWKREDGAWKLHRDIWNSNAAPATAPTSAAPSEGAATETTPTPPAGT
jgi:uncharacterized protein (TIGR02246 family)